MVFGLFSKAKSLQKTIEKATNKLAQQPDRWGALEKLRDDGTEEALFGLCKRFGVTSMKGVEDEQEKHWVVNVLVEKGEPFPAKTRETGVIAKTCDDLRWGRCDIKSVNLLANVLAREEAKRAGVFEAILVKDGLVTEGSVSNVMAVQAGTVVTAPEGPRILSGVTSTAVLELARAAGIPVREQFLPVESLYTADEVFLTGTTVEVLAVVQVEGRGIGAGRPGPVVRALASRWEALTG